MVCAEPAYLLPFYDSSKIVALWHRSLPPALFPCGLSAGRTLPVQGQAHKAGPAATELTLRTVWSVQEETHGPSMSMQAH